MTEHDKQVAESIRKIVNRYGSIVITLTACEELAELTQAITHHYRKGTAETLHHMTEEMADVMIVFHELQALHGVDADEMIRIYHEKLDRQIKRMEENK